jgi:hypothetical protein
VHGDDQGDGCAATKAAQHGFDAPVIGIEKGRETQAAVEFAQGMVAWNRPAVAFRAERPPVGGERLQSTTSRE